MDHSANIDLDSQVFDALRELPGMMVLGSRSGFLVGRDCGADLVVDMEIKGVPYELWVATKAGEVHPKQALQQVEKLEGHSRPVLLAASSLSLEARKALRDRSVGYWDLSGSLFLELPNALYLIEKDPLPQPRAGREPRNVFKGKTAQVVHKLLLDRERQWKVTELADEADVSAYTSQKVLEYLESRLWVTKSGRGPHAVRRLKDPGGLLDAWAREYDIESLYELKLHRYARDAAEQHDQLSRFLSGGECRWAVTLEHGASFWASNLAKLPSSISVWVSGDVSLKDKVVSSEFKAVERGENFRLMITKDEVPFLGASTFSGLKVASPIQVYLDLFHWPKRGREQAEHLRREILRF